jgi:beta-glucosidase
MRPVTRDRFPDEFTFGVATAAYQVEGAIAEGGRVPSIWDTFSARPGAVAGGDTGAVACDHYHRYAADVDLMRSLGVDAYRFSLAWPRIQPATGHPGNAAGIAFYDRLVDRLLEAGITPWATLYHWDLPQHLEDGGGWPARDTAYRFAEYVQVAVAALGDRVGHWITLNEPWVSAFYGYSAGVHAPGRTEPAAAMRAAHHLLLGHGLATQVLRAAVPQAQVGITLNLTPVEAASEDPALTDEVRRTDGMSNRIFLDPVLRGTYPADVLADTADLTWDDVIADGDLDLIGAPIDFLGVNYYHPTVVGDGSAQPAGPPAPDPKGRPRTAMGWLVDAPALTALLRRIADDYGNPALVITENGSAWDGDVAVDGVVHDPQRLAYLHDHLGACAAARDGGVDLRGYFAWSLMDNFEWAQGYAKRFGIVHVDYATQARTVKDSGRWYSAFVRGDRSAP